ncbi:MAG: CSLREA domain-containing protein [Deltaproteobacteria bacterium]|nr:CSLREA domain-containing protein [Deltaproteobacteria bacterium]
MVSLGFLSIISSFSSRALAPLLAVVLSLSLMGPAGAIDFDVTKLTDTNDGSCDADCSLREAILAANVLAGEDRVLLGAGVHQLSIAGMGEDLGATGDLDITDDTIMLGLGASSSIIDGGAIDRVVDVEMGTTVTIQGVTVRNGLLSNGSGAGIAAGNAELTLVGCTITDNHVGGFGFGGGLGGDMTIIDSTISANSSDGGGGGLVTSFSTITNSTFSGNESLSDLGGAIYVFSLGMVTVDGATIVGNESALLGGGVLIEGSAVFSIANSVLADNMSDAGPDCSGLATSRGYNLLGNNSGCSGFGATGDQVGTSSSPIDPLLSPLANHGGPTDTHQPMVGSPLVDAGNPAAVGSSADACTQTDQRGMSRPIDGDGDQIPRCDIGSFEVGAIFADGFESGDTSTWSLTFP